MILKFSDWNDWLRYKSSDLLLWLQSEHDLLT